MTQTGLTGRFYLMLEQWLPEEIKEEFVFSNRKHPLASATAEKYSFSVRAA